MLSKLSSRISQSLGLGARGVSTAPSRAAAKPASDLALQQSSSAAVIGMLANDSTSVNAYTIHYHYAQQKKQADVG